MKIKNVPVDPKKVKAGKEDGLAEGECLVYPSTFIRQPDAYGDVVKQGAFANDIERWKESGDVLPGLWGHRMDDPDFYIASTLEEGEDEHGWWVHGLFDLDHPKAERVYKLVKGRRVTQLSFAYDVIDEGGVELENGMKANELRELKRYEWSIVPIGANQDTSIVAVKALADSLRRGTVSKSGLDYLVEARDALNSVIIDLGGGGKSVAPAAASHDQAGASGPSDAKAGASDEESERTKSPVTVEEQKTGSSVAALAAQARLYALRT